MLRMKNLDELVAREQQRRKKPLREDLMGDELRKAALDTKKRIHRIFDTKIKTRMGAKLTDSA